jgi:hypothetical protein
MNWTYIAAFSATWLASYHYVRAVHSRGLQPSGGPGLALFHACGLLSGILLVALLIGGFIHGGSWWQPIVTVVVAGGVTFVSERILPTRLMPGWISLFTLAAIVLSVAWAGVWALPG